VALDHPATPPDRPEVPESADVPADPHGVANLTRAEAFKSHRYWSEVARFQSAWDKIEERFPDRQEPMERAEPDASVAVTAERRLALDKISDREPAVSADMKDVEAEAKSGGFLVGFEFRLKAAERLSQKVDERTRREPERDPEKILGTVHDAIRYTFCIPKESYAIGCEEVKSQLESRGYEMYHRRNSWSGPEYKGLNTRWITPDSQRFEVQFHTEESFHAKHDVTHLAYERLRRPGASTAERRELSEFQKLVSSYVPVPDGAQDISNFDRDL
jgi:hypothetical protein